MLNIPDAIKALFKTDGVFKNFRAQIQGAPGLPDITNSDIVRESLKFTESVCSDSAFRFGGCERSVIEFETVGVDNIQGRLITCAIEIDTTSLSAAQLTAIGANPGDGTLVLAAQSDIGRGYYRVPLGVFRVATCPRDHLLKAHRKVTAYSPRPWRMNPVESAKMDWVSGIKTYKPDAELLTLSLVEYNCPGFMAAQGWTKAAAYSWDDANTPPVSESFSKTATLPWWDGTSVQLTVSGTRKYQYFNLGDDISGICSFDVGSAPAGDIVEYLQQELLGVDFEAYAATMGPVPVTCLTDFIRWSLREACVSMLFRDDNSVDGNPEYRSVVLDGNVPAFYADKFDQAHPLSRRNYLQISVPDTVTFTVTRGGTTSSETFTMGATAPVLSRFSHASAPAALPLAIQSTDSFDYTDRYGDPCTYQTFADGYDPVDLLRGLAELHGQMFKIGRGLPGYAQLDPAPGVSLVPADFVQAWWDDVSAEPIGQVTFNFGENHDQPGVWGSSADGSVYDMTGNAILAKMAGATFAGIIGKIELLMMNGLNNVYMYMSASVAMRAWPWLEAGDCVEIYSEDPDEDPVYVCLLNRSITGVQLLMDDISAEMGQAEDDYE